MYGENHIDEKIREAIDTNIDMYEFVMDEDLTAGNLGEFLTIAYKVYEAFCRGTLFTQKASPAFFFWTPLCKYVITIIWK